MIEAPLYSAAGARQKAAFALPGDLFDGTVHELTPPPSRH